MNPGTANEGRGGMAEMAIQAGVDMCRDCIYHAGGGIAIVTGNAVIDDTGMVEGSRDEGACIMANTAILRGSYMILRFSDGESGTMAGCAVVHDACMAEGRRQEAGGLVTVDTILVGGYMTGRWDFARRGGAIVAGIAIVDDAAMVEAGADKSAGIVAH